MTDQQPHAAAESSIDENATRPLAELLIHWDESVMIAAFRGEVDRSNAPQLESSVRKSAGSATAVILDISALSYLDSAALSMIQTLTVDGLPLSIVAPTGSRAYRLIEIAGLHTVLSVFESVDEALHVDRS